MCGGGGGSLINQLLLYFVEAEGGGGAAARTGGSSLRPTNPNLPSLNPSATDHSLGADTRDVWLKRTVRTSSQIDRVSA